jgi:hypothetical protein
MYIWILFYLIIFGLTEIIVSSQIFKSIRNYVDKKIKKKSMLHCSQCIGFWVTILVSLFFNIYDIELLFLLACAGSGISLFLHTLLMLMVDLSLLIKNKMVNILLD